MKRTLLICALILLIPLALAQTTTNIDDFEDETPGSDPVTSFGTWTDVHDSLTFKVETTTGGNPLTGTQALQLDASNVLNALRFTANDPGAFTKVGAWINAPDGADGTSMEMFGDAGTEIINAWSIQGNGDLYDFAVKVANCGTDRAYLEFTVNYQNKTYGLTALKSDLSLCYETLGKPWFDTANTEATRFEFSRGNVGSGDAFIDDFFIEQTLSPEPPTGVYARTLDNTLNNEQIEVRFTQSPSDGDPAGVFSYKIYGDYGTGMALLETISPGNADEGYLTAIIAAPAAATKNLQFEITATNPTSNVESGPSCKVIIDIQIQDDSDRCGEAVPGLEEPGSELTGPAGALFGGNRENLAATLQVSESALNFLIGFLLTLLISAGGWFAYKGIGAGLGFLLGLVVSAAIDLIEFWMIYVLIFMLAAIAIIVSRATGGRING